MAAVDDYLTCPICLDWFKYPRRLPCNHVYCLQCLRSLVYKDTYHIACPECRVDHVVPNNRVEEFPADFRLEQLIEEKRTQSKPKSDDDDWKVSSALIKCQPDCRECLRIRINILESLLHASRQFSEDFLTKEQIIATQNLKTHLLNEKQNLCALKIKVSTEIEGQIKELEKRELTLLSIIDGIEKSIVDDLAKVDQADDICDKYESQTACLVDRVLPTKTLILFRYQFSKQNELMTSLQDISQNTRVPDVQFNRDELMKTIASYGAFFEAGDRMVVTPANVVKLTIDYLINVVKSTIDYFIELKFIYDSSKRSQAKKFYFYLFVILFVLLVVDEKYATDFMIFTIIISLGLFVLEMLAFAYLKIFTKDNILFIIKRYVAIYVIEVVIAIISEVVWRTVHIISEPKLRVL